MLISQIDERPEGDIELQLDPKQKLPWIAIVSKSNNPSLVVSIAQALPGLQHLREANSAPLLSLPAINPQSLRKIKGFAS